MLTPICTDVLDRMKNYDEPSAGSPVVATVVHVLSHTGQLVFQGDVTIGRLQHYQGILDDRQYLVIIPSRHYDLEAPVQQLLPQAFMVVSRGILRQVDADRAHNSGEAGVIVLSDVELEFYWARLDVLFGQFGFDGPALSELLIRR